MWLFCSEKHLTLSETTRSSLCCSYIYAHLMSLLSQGKLRERVFICGHLFFCLFCKIFVNQKANAKSFMKINFFNMLKVKSLCVLLLYYFIHTNKMACFHHQSHIILQESLSLSCCISINDL